MARRKQKWKTIRKRYLVGTSSVLYELQGSYRRRIVKIRMRGEKAHIIVSKYYKSQLEIFN